MKPHPSLFALSLLGGIAAAPSLFSHQIIQVGNGFASPTDIQATPGSGLLIVERPGRVMLLNPTTEQTVETPVLNIQNLVDSDGEGGLLGLALHPNFAENHQFFVNYTRTVQGQLQTVVARYELLPDRWEADPQSGDVIFVADQPYSNHNAGQLQFGPKDGYLYLALGDGGSGGDPDNRAQDPSSLFGKMLRIDVDGDDFPANDERDYAIPADNPFVGNNEVRDEIWALGLRNPWRYSFDPVTGDLFIADVGQDAFEEINHQPDGVGGLNYGWPRYEGDAIYRESATLTVGTETVPVATYGHEFGSSITGGYPYRPEHPSIYAGDYIYTDFTSGRIWRLSWGSEGWESTQLRDTNYGITTMGAGADGSIYFASFGSGTIFKLLLEDPTLDLVTTETGVSLAATASEDVAVRVEQSTDLQAWSIWFSLDPDGSRTEPLSNDAPRFFRLVTE
ncbi:MAG: PQQ-dependent sugar dehydrogenase [Verrucomicrobiota bacterium JB022]|nr:PQQ-dependent sugar dehydrogenase [Verrucomicrobiota bacterium JB022]